MKVEKVKVKLPPSLEVHRYTCQRCMDDFTSHTMDKVQGAWYAWPKTPKYCPSCGVRLE